MISGTHEQERLLAFIASYQAENFGVSPSFEEMKEALGLKSKCGVHRIILALEERGRIRRIFNRARAIEIITPTMADWLTVVPTILLTQELSRRAAEARSG